MASVGGTVLDKISPCNESCHLQCHTLHGRRTQRRGSYHPQSLQVPFLRFLSVHPCMQIRRTMRSSNYYVSSFARVFKSMYIRDVATPHELQNQETPPLVIDRATQQVLFYQELTTVYLLGAATLDSKQLQAPSSSGNGQACRSVLAGCPPPPSLSPLLSFSSGVFAAM